MYLKQPPRSASVGLPMRHTCGAWLALTGAHPNAVRAVMRHSTIMLTMDTYGHLFPGQEAETVARLAPMMGDKPTALRATGTDGSAVNLSKKRPPNSPQWMHETSQEFAKPCVSGHPN